MECLIEEMKLKDLEETLNLVKKVFNKYVAPSYSDYGIQSFYNYINYDNIKEQLKKDIKIFIVKDNSKIIGMIAIKKYSHISLLFVDEKFQKKGIATKLVEKAKDYCRDKKTKKITVNSSPYAKEFYNKIGFKDLDVEKIKDGIKFIPMKLDMYFLEKYNEKYFNYLFKTKKDCFKKYVEKYYGEWEDEFQLKMFTDFINKDKDTIKLIRYKEKIIGMISNNINKNNEDFINIIYIDRKYQGNGIGKSILTNILEEDKKQNINTKLRVFRNNKARFLYEKLGFETYEKTKIHYKMIRKIR